MKFFNKLEEKCRRSAFPNVMIILLACYGAGFLISMLAGEALAFLWFDPQLILKGQIWRLFTFVFVNQESNVFMAFITCFIYFSISKALEQILGRFRVNFFLIGGLIVEVVFGFLYYFFFGRDSYAAMIVNYLTPTYLYAMMFVLFAIMYPEARFLFMFIIPIKGKWMVFITFALYAVDVVRALRILPAYGWLLVFMILAAVLSLVLFLMFTGMKNSAVNVIKIKSTARARAQAKVKNENRLPRHRCVVCGRTDLSNPELEFRYCSKCEGDYEYCQEHLYTHIHITGNGQ